MGQSVKDRLMLTGPLSSVIFPYADWPAGRTLDTAQPVSQVVFPAARVVADALNLDIGREWEGSPWAS